MTRVSRKTTIACVCALAIILIITALCCSCSSSDSAKQAATTSSASSAASVEASSSATSAEASSAVASSGTASSAAADASASSTPSATKAVSSASPSTIEPAINLDKVVLRQTTAILEYSNKTVDPLTLVKCENEGVTVETLDLIDLSTVGLQSVTYQLSAGGKTSNRTLEFQVRDIHKPTIYLEASSLTTTQDESIDYLANVKSVSDSVDGELEHVYSEPETAGTNAGFERFYDNGWYIVSDETVDFSVPRTYTVEVLACDIHGNRATRTFNIVVNPAKKPVEDVREAAVAAPTPAPATRSYVLNTNTHKFHYPDCKSVKQMSEKNKWYYEGTRDEVISMGYVPCKNCNP